MYISKSSQKDDSTSIGDVMMVFVLVVFPIFCLLTLLFRHLRSYYQSFQFKSKTYYPGRPKWMTQNSWNNQMNAHSEEYFRVYRKAFGKQMCMGEKGKEKEKDKLIIIMMRKMLEDILCIPIGGRLLPDNSCVISIPKRGFTSGSIPGEFRLKYGQGRFNNYFEYQMIGDDRMQVAYYIDDGIKYVAGVCIYIQNPYESIIHYRESIVKKLLDGEEYWQMNNLKEESMEIVQMRNGNRQMLVTNNRYGEMKQWIPNGDLKQFKEIGPYTEASFIGTERTNPKILSKDFKVKICQSRKDLVMISIKNGEKMHAEYCRISRSFEYFKCETCNAPDDVDPPSYSSLKI